MANIRVKDLPNTNAANDNDEFIVDSSTSGTRRLSYSELKSEISTDFQGDVNTYKIATLASDNKLDPSQIPDTLSQGLNFVGVANSAGDLTSTTQGDFYVIQTAFDSYQVGDQAVYNGSSYTRVTDGTKQIAEGGTGATTLDAAKVNLEIIDVGTAPNQCPTMGMLGSMSVQDADSVAMGTVEAESLTVDSGGSTQPTQSVVTNAGAESSALELRNSAISADTATALTFTNSTIAGANYGKATIAAVRTNEANGNTDVVISTSASGSLSEAVRIDSSGNVTAKSADPVLTVQDTETASGSANATLRLAESGAAGALGSYWDIKANGGALEFNDEWNEGAGTGTRMVIDDAGRIGIGLSNPGDYNSATRDLVVGATTSNHGISIVSGNGSAGALMFADSDSDTVARIQYNHASDLLKFRVAGGEKVEIDSSGNVNLLTGGIDFGAVASGTGTVTPTTGGLLDDFESGTWTPADGSGAGLTFTYAEGTYIKVGGQVTCWARIEYPVTSDTTAAAVQGFPFPFGGSTVDRVGGPVVYTNYGEYISVLGVNSQSKIQIFRTTGSGPTNANLSGKQVWFTATYNVS